MGKLWDIFHYFCEEKWLWDIESAQYHDTLVCIMIRPDHTVYLFF